MEERHSAAQVAPLHASLQPFPLAQAAPLFSLGAAGQVHLAHLIVVIHQLFQHVPVGNAYCHLKFPMML